MNRPDPHSAGPARPHRGTSLRPASRFDTIRREPDPEFDVESNLPNTQFLPDASDSIITHNDSPDLGFSASLNPYRGCEHGCAYCYARPTHEFLGFSAGIDFESKIVVKHRAPELLTHELASPRWKPTWLALSGVTDAYQPVESRLKITRRCLEVLADFRQPVCVVTKNQLVTRDTDLLAQLAEFQAASVFISITTLDPALRAQLEPRTSPPLGRLSALRTLSAAHIPVGVLVAPIIPGLNDHEIPSILKAAAEAGASFASYTILRLPGAVQPVFLDWMDRIIPSRKEKVLSAIKEVRAGQLHSSKFGERMRGTGPAAERIGDLFRISRNRLGLASRGPELSTQAFRVPEPVLKTIRESKGQRELF